MDLELGKWLLDVAKYMLTALLFANFFGDMSSEGTIIVVVMLMLALLGMGLWLVHKFGNDEGENKKKGR